MITDKVKAKVEAYMRTHYDAKDIIWGEDSCTVFRFNIIHILYCLKRYLDIKIIYWNNYW